MFDDIGDSYYMLYELPGKIENATRVLGILSVIALIASIIITVMLYSNYVGGEPSKRFSIWDSSTWRSFLNFDVLIIEKILKGLYVFFAISSALGALVVLITSAFIDYRAFIAAIVLLPIATYLHEIILRVGYEYAMLSVVVARNSTDILAAIGGARPSGGSEPTVRPTTTPSATCPVCGLPVSPGARFCGHCGHNF